MNEVLAGAETGNPVSPALIKAKLSAIRAERRVAIDTKKPDQIAKGNTAPKSVGRQHADRRTRAHQQRQAREEQERAERLTPLIRCIVDAIGPQNTALFNKALTRRHPDRSTVIRLLAAETQPTPI